MELQKHTRRDFLRLASLSTAGVIVAACAGEPEIVEKIVKETVVVEKVVEKQVTVLVEKAAEGEEVVEEKVEEVVEEVASKYKEAPMLAERVAAGELPPVDERLPEEPLVVEVIDAIGQYGGTLTVGSNYSTLMGGDVDRVCPPQNILRIAPNLQEAMPGPIKAWDFTDGFTKLRWELRKGLKWSDGTPVTTEDVRFVMEDVYGDEKITPIYPAKFRDGGRADGEIAKLDIIDDLTWKLSFNEPYGGLLREISIKGWQGYTDMMRPSHVLKQWHVKYADVTSDAFKAEYEKLNLKDEWWQVFAAKNCNNWDLTNPRCANFPVLFAWVNTTPTGQSNILTFERNPYYWKVDNTGQQLPYIDKLQSQQVNDVEMLTLKVFAGEVDFVRESTALNKLPLYKENEQSANLKITLMDNHVDPTCLYLNYTYADENWRKVVNDIRFRQALTHGINRQEIIDTVYFGYGQMPTLVPRRMPCSMRWAWSGTRPILTGYGQ